MGKKAVIGREIVIDAANRTGLLSDICTQIIRGDVEIAGLVGVVIEDGAKIMVVTSGMDHAEALLRGAEFIPVKEAQKENAKPTMWDDDISRGLKTLKTSGFKFVEESDVVIVELYNGQNTLKAVVDILAANRIDIKHIYTTVSSSRCPAKLVLMCDDNKKAVDALNGNL